MKSISKEDNPFSSIKLGDILNPKEISEVAQFFKKNNPVGAKKYLNESQRKKRLEEKGVLPDFLYYNLELMFS